MSMPPTIVTITSRWKRKAPSQPGAPTCHLGDRSAAHGGVGLTVAWRDTAPRGQMSGRSETPDIADLGDEDGGEDRSDTGQLLDRVIADVVAEEVGDRVGEAVDLVGQRVDEHNE